MPFESGSLTVRRVVAERWALVDALVYQGRRDRFASPQASARTSPRCLAVTLAGPRFGAYTLAAVLHDWLVSEGLRTRAVTSRQADGISGG